MGQDLITVPVPDRYGGRSFFDVFSDLKREQGMIALAIQRHRTGDIVTNPDAGDTVAADDRLVVISARALAGAGGRANPRTGRQA